MTETKQVKRQRRHKRIKAKISGTKDRLRLCVFRSHSHIYAQLIDDDKKKVICSANDLKIKASKAKSSGKEEMSQKRQLAFKVGKMIAEKALEKKIEKVVFDRGGYKYHGRIKAVAEGAREGGLQF